MTGGAAGSGPGKRETRGKVTLLMNLILLAEREKSRDLLTSAAEV